MTNDHMLPELAPVDEEMPPQTKGDTTIDFPSAARSDAPDASSGEPLDLTNVEHQPPARTELPVPRQKRWYEKMYRHIKDAYAGKNLRLQRGLVLGTGLLAVIAAYAISAPGTATLHYQDKQWYFPSNAKRQMHRFMNDAQPATIEQKLVEADQKDGKQDQRISQEGMNVLK